MSAMNDFAKAMGDALTQNVSNMEQQFSDLRDLSNKNLEILQGEIASMNDKFTFLLEAVASLEKKMEECCSTASCNQVIQSECPKEPPPTPVEEPEEQPEEEPVEEPEEEPNVVITAVVEAPHKEVVVKTEPNTVQVTVDLQDEESVKNAAQLMVAAAVEAEKEEEEEEEEELALVEKMLKAHNGTGKRKYYVTEDEEREIYEILEDGEPGDEPIGKLKPHGKSFRAHYFKKNEK